MHLMIEKNKMFHCVFEYLFAFGLMANLNSIWTKFPNGAMITNGLYFLLAFATIGCICAKRKIRYADFHRGINICVFLSLYLFIFWIVSSYRAMGFFKIIFIALIIIMYGYFCDNDAYETLYKYGNIIFIVAVISLFFWITGSCLGIISPSGVVYSNWTANGSFCAVPSYFGLYYDTQSISFFGMRICRNTAVFTEAPMCSFNFSLAFLIESFLKDKPNQAKRIILIIAVLSTFSTTGIIIVILTLFLQFVKSGSNSNIEMIVKVIVVPIAIVIISNLIFMLIQEKIGVVSRNTRVDDWIVGFKAWMDHPFIGNGYGNYYAIRQYMSSFRANNIGFSNSIMYILAYGGIYLALPYVLSIVLGLRNAMKNHNWNVCAFVLLFLFMFSVTITSFLAMVFYILVVFVKNDHTIGCDIGKSL